MNSKKGWSRGLLYASVLVLLLGLLGGCGSDQPRPVKLEGELTYAGNAELPAGSNARVSMVERDENGADKRIVAERSLHELGSKPIRFDISVDTSLLEGEGRYGLRAEITDGDGNVRWTTPQPHVIDDMSTDTAVTLNLEATPQPQSPDFTQYRCQDGFHLAAARVGERAILRLGNRRLELQPAGDSHYTDLHDNELTFREDGVRLVLDGTEHADCRSVENQSPSAVDGKNDNADAQPEPDTASDDGSDAS